MFQTVFGSSCADSFSTSRNNGQRPGYKVVGKEQFVGYRITSYASLELDVNGEASMRGLSGILVIDDAAQCRNGLER